MVIDYKTLYDEIVILLEGIQTVVLATCADGRVTARTMNFVNDELTIYFQTSENGSKAEQIRENSNVAIAVDNIQIEAMAHFTTDVRKIEFCSTMYKSKYPQLYEKYIECPEEPTLICKPVRFQLYKFIDRNICFDVLDVKEKKAYRIHNIY
ncbi:MAG: pyridoxamine 5'-phosphate oxidase family protein [Oscillospiraceae bacterium]|jgi:general stress protein 26|nr:pyridoxamine 5'-phosphate oxidase family protein [Oscillospiraceae bacterium]